MNTINRSRSAGTTTSRDTPPAAVPLRPNGHWMPWSAANRPATSCDEQRFLSDLRLLATAQSWSPDHDGGPADQHGRSDTTAVLNALRCSLTVEELFDRAPGLNPVRILRSYLDLDARRQKAISAWNWIVADPSDSALCEWGPDAATLMSPLVSQLRDVARRKPKRYAVTVANLAVRVEEISRCIVELERALDAEPRGSQQGVELGRILYDPAGSALTNQPTHLPARVGTLTPPRVATLLGERQEVTFALAG